MINGLLVTFLGKYKGSYPNKSYLKSQIEDQKEFNFC